MIPYARLTPGPGWRPIRALLYYVQRIIVWYPLRRCVAQAGAMLVRVRHPHHPTTPTSLVTNLRKRGYVVVDPPLLTDPAIGEMVEYLKHREVVLRDGRRITTDVVPAGEPLADYPLATVLACPHVIEIANHPMLLNIATAFLGCSPTISSIGLRWNYPTTNPAQVQKFHRDTDDWRFIKFFTYLTDVDERTGPHVFVEQSHLTSGHIRARPYTQAEILHRYGRFAISSIVGPRGTMFFADTSGIHKGLVPIDRPRLIFEVGYSLLPVFAFDYRPERCSRSVDPYVNRLIISGPPVRAWTRSEHGRSQRRL